MQFFAPGWGLMTMALPALMEIRLLYITVEVGLVEGISAATTPMGTPISVSPRSGSERSTPTVRMSRMDSQVMRLPSSFFSFLSSQRPKPVSRTASLASSSAWSMHAAATASQMRSSFSWGKFASCSAASLAAATRFRTSWMDCKSRSKVKFFTPFLTAAPCAGAGEMVRLVG